MPRPYRRRPKFRFVADEGRDERAMAPCGPPEPFEMMEPPSDDGLALQMKQLVAREMRRVRTWGGAAPEVARTLASLAQTLKTLRTLPVEGDEAQGGDTPDFDPEEYRAEIARRLDAIAAQKAETAIRAGSTDGGGI